MRLAGCLALGLVTLGASQYVARVKAASQAATPVAPAVEPALKARIDAWWKARVARDHKVMYELFDAEYRAACSYEAFVAQNVIRTRFDITSHEVLSATREGDRAKVTLNYVTKIAQFGEQTMSFEETWVRDPKGEWWKLWEPVATPFPVPTPAPGTPRNLPCKLP